MFVTALLIGSLVSAAPLQHPPASDTGLVVEVNAGMELLGIMAWLSQRYPTPPDSRYKAAVWSHFSRYRNHPDLAPFRSGRIYPDFTEAGLWITGFPRPSVSLPDTSSWYRSMGRDRVTAMMRSATHFAVASHFADFRHQHDKERTAWTKRVRADIQRLGVMATVEQFYRGNSTGSATVRLYLEPLNGWGAHMIDVKLLNGAVVSDGVVRFQFGPDMERSLPSDSLNFAMNQVIIPVVWHEAGHAFVRSLMSEHASRIDSLARLFDAGNSMLKRQNVTTWRYAFEENVVRSVVAVLLESARGTKAMDDEVKRQVEGGFIWVPLLSDLIRREYVSGRSSFPVFDAFANRIFPVMAARQNVSDVGVP